jgi:methanogenic corrinoid protein MtbC1
MDATTGATTDLWAAVEAYDGEAADTALAALLWDRPLGEAVMGVILPFLRQLGERWEDGSLSVAHEHFTSNLLRRRLWAFTARPSAEEWAADGPVILLACPPGERHDLVLLCFSLLLGESGAKARYLGADTPMPAIAAAARSTGADAVVLAATRDTALSAHASSISRMADEHQVFVAGRGATQEVAEGMRAHLLPHDPVAAVGFLGAVLKP